MTRVAVKHFLAVSINKQTPLRTWCNFPNRIRLPVCSTEIQGIQNHVQSSLLIKFEECVQPERNIECQIELLVMISAVTTLQSMHAQSTSQQTNIYLLHAFYREDESSVYLRCGRVSSCCLDFAGYTLFLLLNI